MALTNDEKTMVSEALQVYLQIASRQLAPAQIQQFTKMAEGIVAKLEDVGAEATGRPGNKSKGITDEWYEKVCLSCPKLGASGCTEKVTEKFPGKCDPILHFEREKIVKK